LKPGGGTLKSIADKTLLEYILFSWVMTAMLLGSSFFVGAVVGGAVVTDAGGGPDMILLISTLLVFDEAPRDWIPVGAELELF